MMAPNWTGGTTPYVHQGTFATVYAAARKRRFDEPRKPLGPTPEEREAYEAFAHLGLSEPASARATTGRDTLDADRRAVARRGEADAPAQRIALPGRALLYAFTASHLVLALAAGEQCQIAWVEETSGALRLSPLLQIAPRALRFFRATDGAALLGVDLGAGEVVLRVGIDCR